MKYLWPTKKLGFNFSVTHLIFFTSLSNICWIYVALRSNEKWPVICIYFNFSLRNLLSNAQGQRRPHKVNFIKSVFILKTHENFYCPYDARLPTSDIDMQSCQQWRQRFRKAPVLKRIFAIGWPKHRNAVDLLSKSEDNSSEFAFSYVSCIM